MNYTFSKREKILILVFAVLLLGIFYFKFFLEPLNDSIEQVQINTETEQTALVQNTAKLTKMRVMEQELEEIKAQGNVKPLPAYDNSEVMLTDLNSILSAASDYSLSFGTTSALKDASYIMVRPVTLVFVASSYDTARSIIDELHESANINQISNISMTFTGDSAVNVSLDLNYYELAG
jgi:Tfp pilus assembly protein PilO